MKTTGVSGIPKFGLLDFLGHPNEQSLKSGEWLMLISQIETHTAHRFYSIMAAMFTLDAK